MEETGNGGGFGGGTATRTMCVGVYVDSALRDDAIEHVYNDCGRIVAPSFGFDLIPVLVHAWRSLVIELAEATLVTAAFCISFWLIPFAALTAVGLLAAGVGLRRAVALAHQAVEYVRERQSINELNQVKVRAKILAVAALGCTVALAVCFLLAMRYDAHRVFTPSLWFTGQGLWGAVVLVAVIAACSACCAAVRQSMVIRLPRDAPFETTASTRRLQTIDEQQQKPHTVYGGYRPFIGSGQEIISWSFAQRLVPAGAIAQVDNRARAAEYEQPPFSCTELVDELRDAINTLATETHPETRLPGLVVTDRILVAGTHVGPYRESLSAAGETAVKALIREPRDTARHHLACQVVSWGGEIVTTVFVHASLQGRTLYLEFSTYALFPMPHRYHSVDEVGGDGPRSVARSACLGLRDIPLALLAPRRLQHGLELSVKALRARRDKTTQPRRGVNIGTRFSLRERATDDDAETYFQLRDISKHLKIIERRLLATVEGFLVEAGVDISEFVQRATTILNNGVINSGSGDVNINASAVGDHAQVVQHPVASSAATV